MVRQPSDSDNLSPNQVVNNMQQRKQGLTNETASKNTPRKLKPEAFNFLNKLSKSKEPSTKSEENGMNANKIRKHLMPTAFPMLKTYVKLKWDIFLLQLPDPNSNELSNNTSIESHSESMSGNYETINENVASGVSNDTRSQDYNSIIDETVKPPLPSRPPPVFKYPVGTFSNPNSVPSEDVIQNTQPPELPRSLPARSKIMHSVSAPESSLGNVNIPENRTSYPDKKRQPTARPIHNKPFRPLPSLPIATVEKTETSVPQPDMLPFQYPRPILDTLKTSEVIPYEASIIPGTSNSTAMQSMYPTEELMLNETRYHHTANNSVIQEEVFLTPQQRLAQIITNQSSVTKDVLVSQHRITSAIASRIAKSQNIIDPKEKKTDEPSHIIPQEQQDTNSRMISRRSVQYEEPLKEDNIEPKLSNFETRENTNPRRFTAPDPYHGKNHIPASEEKNMLMQHPWYHNVDSKETQLRLLNLGNDGAFLIRPSSKPTDSIQNTICILFSGRIRNVHIRQTTDGQYALGSKKTK
ncbi:uncharacterized protein CEXT_578411 [Caerostris extrusa]|uniref:SH2 domain-containing protein n=1 Tax=Caerostris extrusa TaxID=172846 RepID=A0AAV4W8C4_CAEEX|nr:uncharacterized protein CEXT_578411 [Caerostris extrusa]